MLSDSDIKCWNKEIVCVVSLHITIKKYLYLVKTVCLFPFCKYISVDVLSAFKHTSLHTSTYSINLY